MSNNQIDEDEQFRRVFNGECDITEDCLDIVGNIKNNYPNITTLYISSSEEVLTELGWRLLGRYIANNTHLIRIMLEGPGLTNTNMSALFERLVRSSSIKLLELGNGSFGINAVRNMLPFLENSPQLVEVSINDNNNINTECFEVLVSTLHNTGIKRLSFGSCNIRNISALERYNLPNLNTLGLSGNYIGREGCILISNQLQKEGSTLKSLYLNSTGMRDEEAELLASVLKHNTKLESITLAHNNDITERGHVAFLKLLNDVSSIESTYRSNNTLRTCVLSSYMSYEEARRGEKTEVLKLIEAACKDNRAIDAGKAKVIRSHLNSQTLKRLCNLQGIEYSYSNIFADVEPVLLPKILALIGDRHGQSELYTALIQTAPDLMSYLDRKALIRDTMAKNTARATALASDYESKVAEYQAEFERKMAALKIDHEGKTAVLKTEFMDQTSRLTTENNELSNRLALIDLGDIKHSSAGDYNLDKGVGNSSGHKKRGRS